MHITSSLSPVINVLSFSPAFNALYLHWGREEPHQHQSTSSQYIKDTQTQQTATQDSPQNCGFCAVSIWKIITFNI